MRDMTLVHESNPVFEPIWGAAVNQISSTIYLTAYCHYLDWHHHKYSKFKSLHETAQSSSTGNKTSTASASISSDLTLVLSDPSTSSSDLTMISSTGLLPDAHPEPLAKKAKTQSAEEPKSQSKSKKTKTKTNGKGKQNSGL
ncbi:hypothetical protein EV424DRAFT_1532424 [Suillus variegatus]|nr:hypothetical protein EV424DRAFT_1532424 [Suillus variegatus]